MQGIGALSWLAAFLATCSAGLLQERGEIHSAKVKGCVRADQPAQGPQLLNLGQRWKGTKPLAELRIKVSELTSVESSFEFRTFDPEGLIIYGDVQEKADWFILALRSGIPEMHIGKTGVSVTVSGGPLLNDGQWHRLLLKSTGQFLGQFVVLEVDGKVVLNAGLHSWDAQTPLTGHMRLALGGMLINTSELFTEVLPPMDGCIRRWNWLNQNSSWLQDLSTSKPCFEHLSRGSYFSGAGLASFHSQDFPPADAENWMLTIEMTVRPDEWKGTLLVITSKDHQPLLTLTMHEKEGSQSLQLDVKEVSLVLSHRPVRPCLETSLLLRVSAHGVVVRTNHSEERGELGDFAAWKQAWEEGTTLSFGGVPELLEGTGFPGQDYFQGCVGRIRVQGRELDLDSARYKHDSIWSHSCPEWTEHSQGDSKLLQEPQNREDVASI
ncbi:sex hormone-binding globulin [Acipenser ruthenus]|uniref:sex hormone-binding globulin n=1 Tax=Acipenser ruthenus TaxID=7906 RepID=UPI002740F1E3|nr:sex hormone-binding globulin [Acipenser ruthenus]